LTGLTGSTGFKISGDSAPLFAGLAFTGKPKTEKLLFLVLAYQQMLGANSAFIAGLRKPIRPINPARPVDFEGISRGQSCHSCSLIRKIPALRIGGQTPPYVRLPDWDGQG